MQTETHYQRIEPVIRETCKKDAHTDTRGGSASGVFYAGSTQYALARMRRDTDRIFVPEHSDEGTFVLGDGIGRRNIPLPHGLAIARIEKHAAILDTSTSEDLDLMQEVIVMTQCNGAVCAWTSGACC